MRDATMPRTILPAIFLLLLSCLSLPPVSLAETDEGAEQSVEPPGPVNLVGTAPPFESGEPEGPGLGFILGIFTIIVTIIYIIGISFKVMKIYRGEYEPSEPVYLKYK